MRRMILASLCGLATLSCSTTPQPSGSAAAPPPSAAEWPLHGRDYNEQRYSPLKQINADNVGQLGLAWYADLSEKGQWQSVLRATGAIGAGETNPTSLLTRARSVLCIQ